MKSVSLPRSGMSKRNPVLDVFRGMAVVLMMIVDAVPDFEAVYPTLTHAPWEGIHAADAAFPAFVFAMGASAVFSWSGRIRGPWPEFLWMLFLRSGRLFVLGVLFNAVSDAVPMIFRSEFGVGPFWDAFVSHGRVFGVLQRLALAYALGMVIAKAVKTESGVFVSAALLLLCSSAGYHCYAPDAPFDKIGNISRAVDLLVPGAAHAYQGYGLPFDPEGLYGTLSSTASMLLGLLAGHVLREHDGEWEKGMILAFGGAALLAAGQYWSRHDLVGKPLWTSPFALFNAGADMLAMAALGWILFSLPFLSVLFRPFSAFGRNPLLFYLATNFGLIVLWALPSPEAGTPMYVWLYQRTVMGLGGMAFGAALHTVLWCVLWWPLAEWLYRRGIVIKL